MNWVSWALFAVFFWHWLKKISWVNRSRPLILWVATFYFCICKLMKFSSQGYLLGTTELWEPPALLFSREDCVWYRLRFDVVFLQLPETLMSCSRFKSFISTEMIICKFTSVIQAAAPLFSASKTYTGSQQNKFREKPPFLPSSKPKANQAIVTSSYLSLRTQRCKQPRVL